MRHLLAAVIACAAAFSCAAPAKPRAKEQPVAPGALLSAFQVEGDPAALGDAERVRLEAVAVKIVAGGSRMIPPLLADVETNRTMERRMALLKLLVMIVKRLPADSSAVSATSRDVQRAAGKMLASADATDRYFGLALTAVPAKSKLVENSVRMLEDPAEDNRAFANALLMEISGLDQNFRPDAPEAGREGAVKRWRAWWDSNKRRAFFYMPAANPILGAIQAESTRISRHAGPYPLTVKDTAGAPVADAIVAYSYFFTTFDGWGDRRKERLTTDADGNALLGAEKAVAGMRFVGGQLIVTKSGYGEAAMAISPHVLTKNSLSIEITLQRETE